MKRSVRTVLAVFLLSLPVWLSGGENLLNSGPARWKSADGAAIISRAGHRGDDVLQIKHVKENAPEETWRSPAVSVTPGTVLNLSAWMKCNCVALDGVSQRSDPTYNASLSVQFQDKSGKKLGEEKPVLSVCHSVRRTWQYLANQVIVPKNAAALQVLFQFRRHALGIAWASDIRLEKADPGRQAVHPAAAAERKPLLAGPDATGLLPFYLDSRKFTQIFAPGEKISFNVRYRALLKNGRRELPERAVLRYFVRDIDGRQIEQGEVPLSGTNKDGFLLKTPEKVASGVYHEIHAEIWSGSTLWAEDTLSFGIIPTRQFDPKSEPEIFELQGMDELAIRMGVRRRYLIGGNPQDWKLRQAAALKKKYGVKFYTNGLIVATSWQNKSRTPGSNSFFKTDEAAFRADIRKQLLRYRGIIDGVGLMGEMLPPKRDGKDGEKQAADQVEVMRILKEEINRVDPAMQAAAGGYFTPDFELLWEKGLAKYADLVMVHRFSDPAITAGELTKNQEEMKKRCEKIPGIWVDEAYCFGDAENQAPQQHAAYLASGVRIGDWHIYNFKYRDYWKGKALSICYPVRSSITLPEPALFSYNVMIGKLSGLQYLHDMPALKKEGITCYVFRQKATGKLLLAAWTSSGTGSRVLRIGTKGPVTVTTLRGKEIRLAPVSGYIEVGLTPRMQYLEISDPAAKFACAGEDSFPELLDFVHGKTTGVSMEIRSALARKSAVSLNLPSGWQSKKTGTQEFEVMPEATVEAGRKCYGELLLLSNGKPCAAFPVQLNVVPPVQLSAGPVFGKNGSAVRVQIKNSGETRKAVLLLTHSFTGKHHPEVVRRELTLEGNHAETRLDIPVCTTGIPDEYPVILNLSDPNGVPIARQETVFAFFGVPHAKGAHAFAGEANKAFWADVPVLEMDSELWLDGHEMCTVGKVFAQPEQNDGTWKGKEDFSVKLQQCWDEKHYYIRAAVRDARHINDFKDVMLWSGDGIQFRIADAANSGALSSFCIALNREGRAQVWRYRGNEFNKAGSADQVPCHIVRNEQTRETLYELVFPKKEIEPVTLQPGSRLNATCVFLNRVNRKGTNPMVMRLGYGIYGGGGSGDAILYLMPSRK